MCLIFTLSYRPDILLIIFIVGKPNKYCCGIVTSFTDYSLTPAVITHLTEYDHYVAGVLSEVQNRPNGRVAGSSMLNSTADLAMA